MASSFVRTGSIELWTETFGNPEHDTVLLVMGANASGLYWPEELIDLLVRGGCHVIRYDHRDTGRSTRLDFGVHPYAVADLARDALSVLDGHRRDRAHVVGMSMGGTIGQLLALDAPQRLLSLTVMMTAALDVDFVGNLARAMQGEPSPDGLPTPDPRVLRILARRQDRAPDEQSELARRVDEWRALCGAEEPFASEDFLRWERAAIEHAGSFEQPVAHALAAPVPLARGAQLRKVSTPTLVIQGQCDPLNPPPHGRHLASLIPNAKLVEIPGLGHALPRAHHARLAREILAHCRSAV